MVRLKRTQTLSKNASRILVLNAGSSGLKAALFDADAQTRVATASASWGRNPPKAFIEVLSELQKISLVDWRDVQSIGHRIVHGGSRFRSSTLITRKVESAIQELSPLAPLHNPIALKTLHWAERHLSHARHVAVFDTAYYHTLPPHRYIYPLPYAWFSQWGLRRFGFHGISHQYVARRAVEILGPQTRRVITCHLGQGCSVTASLDGKAVATTMGFTPMEGLMMGTRAGSIDPGLLLFVQRKYAMNTRRMETILNKESGLAGISGISHDMRQVIAAARQGHQRAKLAIEMFTDRVCGAIGSMAASMAGADALVLTGGIGEHSKVIRTQVARAINFLGLGSAHILVIPTQEDLLIAKETKKVAPSAHRAANADRRAL